VRACAATASTRLATTASRIGRYLVTIKTSEGTVLYRVPCEPREANHLARLAAERGLRFERARAHTPETVMRFLRADFPVTR
jgi:hypothetical protein